MFFNRQEIHYIWTQLLEWPDITETQFCPTYMPKKNSVEIYLFFIKDGERLRLDYEINLEDYPPVGENWPTEALDKLVAGMRDVIDNG